MGQIVTAKPKVRRVPIIVRQMLAEEVQVTGDFTDWRKDAVRLSHDGDGEWRTVLALEPGEYQYRLLVDGEWKDHADALERVKNPFGSENCVLRIV